MDEPVAFEGDEELEGQLLKMTPREGDILVLTLKSESISQLLINRIRKALESKFEPLKLAAILVFGIGTGDELGLTLASPDELKGSGRCPLCVEQGQWKAMALCCPRHGRFVG